MLATSKARAANNEYPAAGPSWNRSEPLSRSVTQRLLSFVRAGQRVLFRCDCFYPGILQLVSLGRVKFDIFCELRRKIRLRIDGVNGAYIHTRHAINAVLRVNDHLLVHLVEARDGAYFYTVGELAFVTFIGDNVGHGISMVECCV